MRNPNTRAVLGTALVLTAACAPGSERTAPASAPSPAVLEAAARADSVRRHYTQADVDFMTGMIHHHAQALVMARMAESHGASPDIQVLAARINIGQKDEIALMQRWLRERDEPVPEVSDAGRVTSPSDGGDTAGDAHAGHHPPTAGDAAHDVPMAGMLTAEQMARLDAARGAEWDRLFLTYMIQHHQGALAMVDTLFATPGAGQGDEIFRIAADIGADQASEIDRMQRMLQQHLFGASTTHESPEETP